MCLLLLVIFILFLAYIFKHADRDSDGTGKSAVDDILDNK